MPFSDWTVSSHADQPHTLHLVGLRCVSIESLSLDRCGCMTYGLHLCHALDFLIRPLLHITCISHAMTYHTEPLLSQRARVFSQLLPLHAAS